MAFHIRDEKTDALARELALEAELRRQEDQRTRRLGELERFLARMDRTPRTGLKADKAFFDEINGD